MLESRGGTVSFIIAAFTNNLASGSVNLLLWLIYFVAIALYATALGFCAQIFPRFHFHSAAAGTDQRGNPRTYGNQPAQRVLCWQVEAAIVALKLTLFLVVIVLGIGSVSFGKVGPAQWGSFGSIAASGMIIFVACEGFELIAHSAEKISNPKRNLPRAGRCGDAVRPSWTGRPVF